jgi:hypothetical protein
VALRQDLTVEQGADFYFRFASRRENIFIRNAGYKEAHIRADYDSAEYHEFTLNVPSTSIYMEVTMSHNDTAQLNPGRYKYDIKIQDYLTRCQGYIDNTTGEKVFYTPEQCGELSYWVLTNFFFPPAELDLDVIDFDNDGTVGSGDALLPLYYSFTQVPEFATAAFAAFNNLLNGGSYTTNIQTILVSDIGPLTPGKFRVLEGDVIVTPEVTK